MIEARRARTLTQARQLAFADPAHIGDADRHVRYLAARMDFKVAQVELRRAVGTFDYLEHLAGHQACKHTFDAHRRDMADD